MSTAITETMSPMTVKSDLPLEDHVPTPNTSTETSPRSKGNLISGNIHPFPALKFTPVLPRSKHNLLREFSPVQSLANRLRRDRNNWRSQVLAQKRDLEDAHKSLKDQLHFVSEIEKSNAELKAQYDEAVSAQAQLSVKLEALTMKHKKTVQELSEARRRNTLLKKDNRARELVHAHNLRLKVVLHRYLQEDATSAATRTTTKAISSLQNALKVAVERIQELESRGKDLLNALEIQSDAEDKAKGKGKGKAKVSKANLAFRDTLANKWSHKLKSSLDDLLQD